MRCFKAEGDKASERVSLRRERAKERESLKLKLTKSSTRFRGIVNIWSLSNDEQQRQIQKKTIGNNLLYDDYDWPVGRRKKMPAPAIYNYSIWKRLLQFSIKLRAANVDTHRFSFHVNAFRCAVDRKYSLLLLLLVFSTYDKLQQYYKVVRCAQFIFYVSCFYMAIFDWGEN